jgi:hypothetical protein
VSSLSPFLHVHILLSGGIGADDSNLMTRDDMSNIGLGDLEDSHTSLRPDPSVITSTNTTTPNPTPTPVQERI